MFPLVMTDQLSKVDVYCIAKDGGPTGQSGAIRIALSKALTNLVDEEMVLQMSIGIVFVFMI